MKPDGSLTPVDLNAEGFTEICAHTYMRTNELALHRKAHDPSQLFASEDYQFTPATDAGSPFVQDVHEAVRRWPLQLPSNALGRRLWEKVNDLSVRFAAEEDDKVFFSPSTTTAAS